MNKNNVPTWHSIIKTFEGSRNISGPHAARELRVDPYLRDPVPAIKKLSIPLPCKQVSQDRKPQSRRCEQFARRRSWVAQSGVKCRSTCRNVWETGHCRLWPHHTTCYNISFLPPLQGQVNKKLCQLRELPHPTDISTLKFQKRVNLLPTAFTPITELTKLKNPTTQDFLLKKLLWSRFYFKLARCFFASDSFFTLFPPQWTS